MRENDSNFRAEYTEAVREGVEKMETTLKKRAEAMSDTALIFWLKGNDPKYR
jgi:hypothetical protein